jgi:hypothetical protein
VAHVFGGPNTGVSATINGVTSTSNTIVSDSNITVSISAAVVPSGSTGVPVSVIYSGGSNPFSGGVIDIYTVTGWSSSTPTGTTTNNTNPAVATSVTGTGLNTSAGGVIIAGIAQYENTSTSAVVSGSDPAPFTQDSPNGAIGTFGITTSAHASGISTNSNESVTGTFNASNDSFVAAVAWR